MTATTFLVMYLAGGAFAWLAFTIAFLMSPGRNLSNLPEYIGGSISTSMGWPLAILFFIYNALFGKSKV